MATINNDNVYEYIKRGLIDPKKLQIDVNRYKTATDPNHKWMSLESAIKQGYEFSFDHNVKEIQTPTVLPVVEITTTKTEPKKELISNIIPELLNLTHWYDYAVKNFEDTYGLTPRDAAGFLPVVGDALDINDIGKDLYKGNYGLAALGAGLMIVPNFIEKGVKQLYKHFKKISVLKNSQDKINDRIIRNKIKEANANKIRSVNYKRSFQHPNLFVKHVGSTVLGEDIGLIMDANGNSHYIKTKPKGYVVDNLWYSDEDYESLLLQMNDYAPHYLVSASEAAQSDLLKQISTMTGEEQDKFFLNNILNSVELLHQRGLSGAYDRIRKTLQEAIEELLNPEEKRVLQEYYDALINPKFYNSEGYFDNLDYVSHRISTKDYLTLINAIEKLPLYNNLSDEGIWNIYHRFPTKIEDEFYGDAAVYDYDKYFAQGSDLMLLDPKVKAHEINHVISASPQPLDMNNISYHSPIYDEYLNENNGIERLARLSQIMNAYGIKDGTKSLKPVEFDWMRENYTEIPYDNIDNSMTQFFETTKNTNGFLKWAWPVTLAATGVGVAMNAQNDNSFTN